MKIQTIQSIWKRFDFQNENQQISSNHAPKPSRASKLRLVIWGKNKKQNNLTFLFPSRYQFHIMSWLEVRL